MSGPVSPQEWGPPLWRILHTLAERLGNHSQPILATDEARAWVMLLRTTEDMMPCAVCRGHYRTWRRDHPIEAMVSQKGEDLRAAARHWVWELHEAVNLRNEKPPGPTEVEVEEMYRGRGRQDLQEDIETLVEILRKAMQIGLTTGAAVRDWRGKLSLLRKLCSY
jgi:hypothetical protein